VQPSLLGLAVGPARSAGDGQNGFAVQARERADRELQAFQRLEATDCKQKRSAIETEAGAGSAAVAGAEEVVVDPGHDRSHVWRSETLPLVVSRGNHQRRDREHVAFRTQPRFRLARGTRWKRLVLHRGQRVVGMNERHRPGARERHRRNRGLPVV
jgi:hypothetical protein